MTLLNAYCNCWPYVPDWVAYTVIGGAVTLIITALALLSWMNRRTVKAEKSEVCPKLEREIMERDMVKRKLDEKLGTPYKPHKITLNQLNLF